MCGIAGAVGHFDDSVVDAVAKMRAALSHRGPDAEGIWSHQGEAGGAGVVLAHRRLSIIDLSAQANQPMVDPRSGCVIVYNGEVYNFKGLRRQLETLGATFQTACDTEVVLRSYEQWGPSCVQRFNGMFALAVWDPRQEHVFLARDRLGIKPLYLARARRGPQSATWLFASEIRALLASGLVDGQLDPVGLATYLWNGMVVGPTTILRDVTLLPAATTVTITLDGQRRAEHRYWQLPSTNRSAVAADTAALAETLAEAVKQRLVSDVPLGVFMSGGIDSSAIAALACRDGGQAVKTFNVSFDEAAYDEAPHARAVAGAVGAEHHEVRLTEAGFADHLDEALESIDQPTFDGINTYFISRAVREAGIKVALAGTGGDELFGGYRSFQELPRLCRWARRAGVLPSGLIRHGAHLVSRIRTGRPGEVAPQTRWGKLADALGTRGGLVPLYQVAYGLFTRAFLRQLSAVACEPGTRLGLPAARAEELTTLVKGSGALNAVSLLEVSCFLGERLLRDTDAASMAVSLEVRVPLLDHRVLESLALLDPATRFEPLGRKQALRRAALADLDPALFERPKSGFVLPLEVWCRRRLRDTVASTMNDESLCRSVGLEPDAVARLWRSYEAQAPGMYWSRIWALFILLWWCRRHDVSL